MALLDRAIVRALPIVPKPVVQMISARYIAGRRLEDACRVVGQLNRAGKMATVDVLGEEISNTTEALAILHDYQEVLAEIERNGLDSNVSVKLTALGLKLGYECARENLEILVADAAKRANFVRIDMDDSSTTDETLCLYRDLRDRVHDNVGIVLQACMRRTVDDIRGLAEVDLNVRLCKGIYVEPPEVAYQGFEEVRENFVRCLGALWDIGAYVGIATHDEWLIAQAQALVAERGLGPDEYEFQMLLGVREARGDELVRDGHRLRIYVPFGEHWYEYSVRRLQENPKIAGYIAADTFSRILHLGRNNR